MKCFILEDEIYKQPRIEILRILSGHELTITTSCEMAKNCYRYNGNYGLILLDHDMHGYPEPSESANTGYQFVKWLTTEGNWLTNNNPRFILHSQNSIGRRNMKDLLVKHKFQVDEFYFGPEYLRFLREAL